MIDIRSHLLDGTDGGPASFEESLRLCSASALDGVREVVATPLWEAGIEDPPLPMELLDRKVHRLMKQVGAGPVIKVGFVFEFSPALPRLVQRFGRRLALGGKNHLLVSLPKTSVPTEVGEVWDAVTREGFSVVIASAESSPALRRQPELLDLWWRSGVKFQFNAASVVGVYGRDVQKFTFNCLQRFEGTAAVASNSQGKWSDTFLRARAELVKHFGLRRAMKFVSGTPSEMLGGLEFVKPDPSKKDGRSLGGLLRSIQPIRSILN